MKNILLLCTLVGAALGCERKLPACDSGDTTKLLEKVLLKKRLPSLMKARGFIFKGLSGHKQEKYLSRSDKRICSVVLASDRTRERIYYHVVWRSKKERRFEVRTLGNGFPRCESYFLANHLHALLKHRLGAMGFKVSALKQLSATATTRECGFELLAGGRKSASRIHITSSSPFVTAQLQLDLK